MTMEPAPRGLTDADLTKQASFVRSLVVQRLEQIWSTVAPHVDGSLAEQGLRPDPRFIEAGIRVLDRLADIYRLKAPVPAEDDGSVVKVDPSILVGNALRELEARVRERQ
jgi:hypothetical protein